MQQVEVRAAAPSIPIARPLIGEEEIAAVVDVLRSGNIVQGRLVEQFERRFAEITGAPHAVAVSSGTAALHLALLAHGVGPGDEVITSPFTFVATANAVLYTGARPVFVDIRPDTFNLDPDLVAARITPRTKAILPVHLFGQPAEMGALATIARAHRLALIEDAAQAHGASIDGCNVGASGTAAFSFYATKNVTTGEGGLITTDDAEVARRLRLLRSHGQRERYRHECLGFNYRLTDLQAAIGLVQLRHLEEFTAKRIANAGYLSARLAGLATPRPRPGVRHVYHQYTIRLPGWRDEAARLLGEFGIGVGIYYPLPIHRQEFYLGLGYRDVLPEAEKASREVLSLPVHPALGPAEIERIADEVSRIVVERCHAWQAN
jgi:perosamine synthetase